MIKITITASLFLLLSCTSLVWAGTIWTYGDGSGNTYKLRRTMLSFAPVGEMESSSGLPNQQQASKTELSCSDKQQLVKLFYKALDSGSEQIDKRLMGSSRLHYRRNAKERLVILRPKSVCQQEIDQLLAQLLNKGEQPPPSAQEQH